MPIRPGGPLATRPLHFIWMADCSGSMAGPKMTALNNAIREAIPEMRQVAEDNPHASILVRAIAFSSGAWWHIEDPVPIDKFHWDDLSADGVTDMGAAFKLAASVLAIPPMTTRALPPVLVLLSDGQPTDDWKSGLETLLALPWGKKAVRIAIAIGDDADEHVLQEFIGHPELKPLKAKNPEALVKYIKWASTVVVQAASAPSSTAAKCDIQAGNVHLPPPDETLDDEDDVW